jgi:hypothetical protein
MQNCHGFGEQNEMRAVVRLSDGPNDAGMFFVDSVEKMETAKVSL